MEPQPENSEKRNNEFERSGGKGIGHGAFAAERPNGQFHKTQMCFKFMVGKCHFNCCRFAHGKEELRPFQRISAEDEQEIHRARNAKRHRGEDAALRDSEVISVATTSGSNEGVLQRPIYKKPVVCYQWEAKGTCSFGDNCRFPHGPRKLADGLEGLKNGGSATSNWKQSISNMRSQSVFKQGGSPPKLQTQNVDRITGKNVLVVPIEKPMEIDGGPTQAQQGKKGLAKWKWPQKISRIYGDWIDEE